MHFHQQIHEYLLNYRKNYNSNFNFLVRQKSSPGDKKYPGGKIPNGLFFQGTEKYCFVGLVDKNGGNLSTRSVGLVFEPSGDNFVFRVEIIFLDETNPKLIEFYKNLASEFEGFKWYKNNRKAKLKVCEFPKDNPSKLYQWLDENYPKIRNMALESDVKNLIPDDERFQKLQNNLKKKLEEVPLNYWIFQGNPKVYDFESALSDGSLQDFTVSSHKDKIKVGDKVIIWLTGKQAGCYALAEITSEPSLQSESSDDKHWKQDNSNDLKAGIKITHNLYDNPILWEDIKDLDAFKDFKAGNQGSNFKSNHKEYETLYKLSHKNNFSKSNSVMAKTNFPLNQILFGPPGTGKTFRLQSEYFKIFTQYSASTSRENYLKEEVEPLAWWQVLYIALLDLGKVRVNDILAHPAVQAKAKLSTINNLRASLWGALQRHTAEDCPNVGVESRAVIKPFWKTDHSEWHIEEDENLELFPEAKEILDTYKNYDETNSKEIKNYSFVTFHQSFTYEDFVEGIKPVLDNETDDIKYEISDGVFKRLALKAQDDPDNDYAIFIDEINRGNVASIFGELITLIEKDKRQGAENELSVILPYSKTKFSVPQNLHIIGTMNTADRSVEALDTALRRRFSFIEMPPLPEVIMSNGKADVGMLDGIELPFLLQTINTRIEKLLDKDHKIGHSYFLSVESVEDLRKVFRDKVIPLLEEYFFGDYGKIGLVLGNSFIRKMENNETTFASFDDYDESIVSDLNQREVYEKKPMDTWDFKSIYL